MAVVFGVNISPGEKIVLLFFVDTGGHVTQDVLIGVDKAMAGGDISRGTDAHHAQPGAAGEGLVDALV
jgi:hypothetical protein